MSSLKWLLVGPEVVIQMRVKTRKMAAKNATSMLTTASGPLRAWGGRALRP